MQNLDIILGLLAALAALYWVAERLKISYPILLVIGGLVIGIIPGLPVVKLDPDIVFLIFLPPLLFDAARNTSWHDFRAAAAPIGRLAIGLVLFTTAGTAMVAHYFIPGFTWPLAFVLGAIVSPPDAVAATSAIKGLGLPKRIVTVLEGESLVNDASALIAYRYAVATVLSGSFVLAEAGAQFILVAAGGIVIGTLLGRSFYFLVKWRFLDHPTVETSVTFLLPFVSYVIAEHLGGSGVLSVVSTGLYISWRSHDMFSFRTRLQMKSFWETLIFLLNGLVFILIGLQLPDVFDDIDEHSMGELIGYGLLIGVVVVAMRIIWIFPTVALSNLIYKALGRPPKPRTRRRELLVIGWSGMRGVVSLASALALPLTLPNGHDFPERSTILFITFVVILTTLVFQGLTLPWLIRYTGIGESKDAEIAEDRRLRLDMARYSMAFVDQHLLPKVHKSVADPMRDRLERQIAYLAKLNLDGSGAPLDRSENKSRELFTQTLRSELEMIEHQRKRLSGLHRQGHYTDDSLRSYERELDIRSMDLAEKLEALDRIPR